MWTCPNCGRAFRSANQQHDCGKAPETIDEYINAQDETLREPLRQVRAVIQAQLPEAKEKISWSMPTYWQGGEKAHRPVPRPRGGGPFRGQAGRGRVQVQQGHDPDPVFRGAAPGADRRDRRLVPGHRKPRLSTAGRETT